MKINFNKNKLFAVLLEQQTKFLNELLTVASELLVSNEDDIPFRVHALHAIIENTLELKHNAISRTKSSIQDRGLYLDNLTCAVGDLYVLENIENNENLCAFIDVICDDRLQPFLEIHSIINKLYAHVETIDKLSAIIDCNCDFGIVCP